MRIGLFYGSTTCYTEIAAEKIQQQLAEHVESVELFDIKETPLQAAEGFDHLIFGISTWDFGELQEDWENHWEDVATLDLRGKTIALFGMGDQLGYGEWFQDALGMLHDAIADDSIHRIGFWPNQGYEFIASKALTQDQQQFVGLALDEDSQYEYSDERIEKWCHQLLQELQASASQ